MPVSARIRATVAKTPHKKSVNRRLSSDEEKTWSRVLKVTGTSLLSACASFRRAETSEVGGTLERATREKFDGSGRWKLLAYTVSDELDSRPNSRTSLTMP